MIKARPLDQDLISSGLSKGLPCGKYTLKVAENTQEVDASLKLRFQIFNNELGEGIPENESIERDVDEFDEYCDHLLVLSETKEVIGGYRLLYGPNRPSKGFYSESEFDFSKLNIDFNKTVELGRACIHPEFRKQTTLLALFWGLHRYMLARKAKYLLGCASLPPKLSNDDAECTYEFLTNENRVYPGAPITPLPKNENPGDAGQGNPHIPPLLAVYLEFGAKVMGRPAYDPVFACFDLPVFFDMDHLSTWGSELLKRFDKRLNSGE